MQSTLHTIGDDLEDVKPQGVEEIRWLSDLPDVPPGNRIV